MYTSVTIILAQSLLALAAVVNIPESTNILSKRTVTDCLGNRNGAIVPNDLSDILTQISGVSGGVIHFKPNDTPRVFRSGDCVAGVVSASPETGGSVSAGKVTSAGLEILLQCADAHLDPNTGRGWSGVTRNIPATVDGQWYTLNVYRDIATDTA